MKKAFSTRLPNLIFIFLFGTISVSVSSCMNDDTKMQDPTPTPVAFVSLYQGGPDAPDLDIVLDNQKITSQPFKYNSFSGYLNFKPGARKIKFTPANAANALIDTTVNFKENKVYSLFTVNRLQNMDLLVVQDSVKVPASGKAGIRVIHLSPDAPALDIATSGNVATTLASNLNFKGLTLFSDIDSGSQSLQVKKAGSNEVLLTIRDINLLSGKTYSLVIRGFVTPPTGNTNVLSGQLLMNY